MDSFPEQSFSFEDPRKQTDVGALGSEVDVYDLLYQSRAATDFVPDLSWAQALPGITTIHHFKYAANIIEACARNMDGTTRSLDANCGQAQY